MVKMYVNSFFHDTSSNIFCMRYWKKLVKLFIPSKYFYLTVNFFRSQFINNGKSKTNFYEEGSSLGIERINKPLEWLS